MEHNKVTLPAYLHIVDTLSERLSSGHYDTGSRLPSTAEFCAEFGVSPMTLRKALTILSDRGLVTAEKGRGTFVRSVDLGDSAFTLEQLGGEDLDRSCEVQLLSAATIKANGQVATILTIPQGDRVVYLRHLLLNDKVPAIFHREYLVCNLQRPFSELLLQPVSLRGFLRSSRDRRSPRGEITLHASTLDAAAAKALGEPAGTPAFCLEHLSCDTDHRPLSWSRFLLRADLFTLRSCLGSGRTGPEAMRHTLNAMPQR